MNTHMFDIQAKLPEGAVKSQVPSMLRALLAERFKLVVHRETKEESVYALLLGEQGSTLKQASGVTPPAEPPAKWKAGGDQIDYASGENHVTGFRIGQQTTVFNSGPDGDLKETQDGPFGIDHIEASSVTLTWLAKTLSARYYLRVIDMTGLAGRYQMTVDLPASNASKGDIPISTISAIVAKLGLKMEKRKAPIEYLVVDRMEKSPTEN